jgi:hypothetical protein
MKKINMKINFKRIGKTTLYIICVAVLMLVVLKVWHRISNLKEQVEQVTTAHNVISNQNEQLQILISRQGDSLKISQQIILSQKQAIEMGILNEKELRDKYLKEVSNVIELSEEVEILKKQGRFVDTVYIDNFNSYEWIRLPFDVAFGDKWYNLDITVNETPLLNSLTTYSEPTITIGTVKKGLFKKPEKVTIYENANPYIKLKSIESITIKEQTKWYQTTWFKVGSGFIGGALVVGVIQ